MKILVKFSWYLQPSKTKGAQDPGVFSCQDISRLKILGFFATEHLNPGIILECPVHISNVVVATTMTTIALLEIERILPEAHFDSQGLRTAVKSTFAQRHNG